MSEFKLHIEIHSNPQDRNSKESVLMKFPAWSSDSMQLKWVGALEFKVQFSCTSASLCGGKDSSWEKGNPVSQRLGFFLTIWSIKIELHIEIH